MSGLKFKWLVNLSDLTILNSLAEWEKKKLHQTTAFLLLDKRYQFRTLMTSSIKGRKEGGREEEGREGGKEKRREGRQARRQEGRQEGRQAGF